MASFSVPFTDDQVDVDLVRGVVMVFRNAWNRESSGIPDEVHTFEELRSDPGLLDQLTSVLVDSDGAELKRLVARG